MSPRLLTFLTATAILVITPGAATAVVIKNAMSGGRAAALVTAVGIGFANLTWALGSCTGLSVVIGRSRLALDVLKWVGGAYLALLGVQGLQSAIRPRAATPPAPSSRQGAVPAARANPTSFSYLAEGGLTNLLNPAAAVFYTSFIPQFISSGESFPARFLGLSAIHIAMALTCHSFYGLMVGGLTDTMTRPTVRRVIQATSGAALVALAANLVLNR